MKQSYLIGLLILLGLLVSPAESKAQLEDQEYYYGFFAGVSQSKLTEVGTTLIRPIFPVETYQVMTGRRWGFTAGSFIHYRFKNSQFAIQPQILYQDAGGTFQYNDVDDLEYQIDFRYAYLKLSPVVKYYLFQGAFLQLGPELALIVDRSKLKYTSNQPELGPDLQIQQSLSEVLKGNSVANFMLGAGYDTPMGLGIDFRYQYGISDAMETIANGFYFVENKNSQHSWMVSLSYAIPFTSSPY